MIARILSGLIGVLMLLNCFWWILDQNGGKWLWRIVSHGHCVLTEAGSGSVFCLNPR